MNYKKTYLDCWKYLKESKNYIYIIISLFIVSILLGWFLPVPEALLEIIQNYVQELIDKTAGMNYFQLLRFIMGNNIFVAFSSLFLGIIFGILPVFGALLNGYVLGFVISRVIEGGGVMVLWKLFPHGVFEIPALILSLGLGLRLGISIFSRNPKKGVKYNARNALRVFVFVILPLLIIAGIIETSLIFLVG